jgi:glycosyltransferase involved in cell wall biosynthesis
MKVLVISHEYPPIGGGGGKVVQDLCVGLSGRGHQIHLLTALWENLPEKESTDNLTIERLPSSRTQSFRADFKAMTSFVWKSFWRGLKLIRKWQPDLIHAHFAVPAGAAAFALSVFTRTPYIITAHGGDVPGGAPEKTGGWFRFVLPLSKPVWKHAAAIAAVSSQTRQLALNHYTADIHVIPNGIDPSAYHPGKFISNKAPTIIYIGRFSPEKNALAVPQVLSTLVNLDWNCVMLGDGPQMEDVKSLIKHNRLEKRFTLPGWVDPDEVMQWMEKSDILFMPSLRDAMPMAGLQALAMGLALVASEIGSVPDIVKINENGFLVKPGDLNGYGAAITKLLVGHNLLERYRLKSREMAAKFDIKGVVSAYEDLYQNALKGKVK